MVRTTWPDPIRTGWRCRQCRRPVSRQEPQPTDSRFLSRASSRRAPEQTTVHRSRLPRVQPPATRKPKYSVHWPLRSRTGGSTVRRKEPSAQSAGRVNRGVRAPQTARHMGQDRPESQESARCGQKRESNHESDSPGSSVPNQLSEALDSCERIVVEPDRQPDQFQSKEN